MARSYASYLVQPSVSTAIAPEQVINSSGAFVWGLDNWARLQRFLILGSDGGTYYIKERDLTIENAKCVLDCWAEDASRTLDLIKDVAARGLAPKTQPYIFALALCCTHGEIEARRLAKDAIKTVCRTGTQFFQFVDAFHKLGSWTRSTKKAIGQWYTSRSVEQLGYQLLKYKSREGWTHKDVLRLAHVNPKGEVTAKLLGWAAGKDVSHSNGVLPEQLIVATGLTKLTPVEEVIKAILNNRLTHEMIPTEHLAQAPVWNALLHHMPMGALLRNLGRLTSSGVLKEGSAAQRYVCDQLQDPDVVRKSQLHPLKILVALYTYNNGKGDKGSLTWSPLRSVGTALDTAFRLAFGNVEPTGKRIELALDVSSSMNYGAIAGMGIITPRVASVALALINANVEPNCTVSVFSHEYQRIGFDKDAPLQALINGMSSIPFGGTNCALPIVTATKKFTKVDAFVVYTDSETNGHLGNHPAEALRNYRRMLVPQAKLVVVGMTSNGFTIADPKDAGMLDVVGFSPDTPQVISQFIAG